MPGQDQELLEWERELLAVALPSSRPTVRDGVMAGCTCATCSEIRTRLRAEQERANEPVVERITCAVPDCDGEPATWRGRWNRDRTLCDDHVTCGHCGDIVRDYDMDEDTGACNSCRENAFYCDSCGEWSWNADECESDDHGPQGINNYGYKPEPVFWFADDSDPDNERELFLGMELEFEAPRQGSKFAKIVDVINARVGSFAGSYDDLAYLKDDSSISYGAELVTHPMTYRFAMEQFPWDMLDEAWNLGARAKDTTGIHIHVSRAGFTSDAHVYRWAKFIYRNQTMVERISGRQGNSYAQFDPQKRREVKFAGKDVGKMHAARDAMRERSNRDYLYRPFDDPDSCTMERYAAINWQNDHTAEVRVFRSSLRPRKVKAYLALVHASVMYTGTLDYAKVAKARGWEWSAFTAWLFAQGETYRPLLDYLEEISKPSYEMPDRN